jgi:3-oxoacyl-[acyl-carrier protein] reductase
MLSGKTALITGASRGIGRATAIAMAAAGAQIAVNYRCSLDAAREVCSIVSSFGVRVQSFQADVSHDHEATRMVADVVAEFGRIDILVNNAGITRDKSFLNMTRTIWEEVLGVNLMGPFNVTHAVLPRMVGLGWGRIINVASVVGQTGNFGQANYAVTKGGLIALTMTLAREVARKGVTVNAVAPGFIETDMTKDLPTSVLDSVKAMTPLGRLGKPEEVAAAILFLASPSASFITGQVIPVNGGIYM